MRRTIAERTGRAASLAGDAPPGTFTYTPATGTALHAGGGQTLSVRFTPDDSIDFATDTDTASINVNPAPLAITAVDRVKVYGQPNPPLSARYSGFVLGQDPSVLGGSLAFATSATIGTSAGEKGHGRQGSLRHRPVSRAARQGTGGGKEVCGEASTLLGPGGLSGWED